MALAQMLVISLLLIWGRPWHALAVTVLLLAQFAAMRVLLRDPKGKAPWYNGDRRRALRHRHDDFGLRAAGWVAVTLSWLQIVRLGLVQMASARSWC